MLTELQSNLQKIHEDVMNNLSSENVRKDVNLLNVYGSITQGNKFDLEFVEGLKDVVVENVGGSYGFELNSKGYYESNNKKVKSSFAMCKVSFNSNGNTSLDLECINYAESNYDYGLISKLDTELSASNNADSNDLLAMNFKGKSKSAPQTVSIPVTEGNHFIYIKFRKDGSGDSYNDSLQFKITNVSHNVYHNEVITVPYRSLEELKNDSSQSEGTLGILFEDLVPVKAYRRINEKWQLYQDIVGKTVYPSSEEELIQITDFPENTTAILYQYNNYVNTYKYLRNTWVPLSTPNNELQAMNILNQVDTNIQEYEGLGGTEEDIAYVLDVILNEGLIVQDSLLQDNTATIEDGLPNFIGTVENNMLILGGNE